MISAPVTAFAVVPIATANYRAAILCHGPKCHFVRCKDMSEVEVKADLKRDAEFGRDASGIARFCSVASLGGIVKNSPGAGDGSTDCLKDRGNHRFGGSNWRLCGKRTIKHRTNHS